MDHRTAGTLVLAHGIGGRRDLPIPFGYVLVGGGLAVLVSFTALLWLWPVSRLRGDLAGRALPRWVTTAADAPETRWALRLLGLALTAFTAVAALFGKNDDLNPTASFVYVLFWVGLVPVSLLLGPVWRLLNPLRTVHGAVYAALGRDPRDGLRPLPPAIGYWPAAASLLAFTWLELAAPNRDSTTTLVIWFGLYSLVHLGGATLYGSRWFDRGDGFEVYSTLAAHLAPFGRRRTDGLLVVRDPLDGLDALTAAPGLVATVSVLFGSTAFDGASASTTWVDHAQSGPLSPDTANALGLLATVVLVALTFTGALRLAGRITGTAQGGPGPSAAPAGERPDPAATSRRDLPATAAGGRELPARFAHSLVPIAVGYVVAHYFSYLVFNGQQAFILASDPLVTGADLFGTGGEHVNYTVISVTTIALVQVFGVVIGHVLATVAAHDRAVRLFPRRAAVLGQLPLLALMVGYTLGGLLLLFSS